jgi:hypothetical protein
VYFICERHYYVVDLAYPCTWGFLPPYKGKRYHLSQFHNKPLPRGYKELFNYRHSSLRMVIENCFARLKMRWHILNRMPRYLLPRQPGIIVAWCTLHNLIGTHNPNDAIFSGTQATEPEMSELPHVYWNDDETGPSHAGEYDLSDATALEIGHVKEGIAQAMWANANGHEDGDN